MQTQTLIIGGGLSGLALAARLSAEEQDFLLVEARERWGGRILVNADLKIPKSAEVKFPTCTGPVISRFQ